jgi:hypothetical protein
MHEILKSGQYLLYTRDILSGYGISAAGIVLTPLTSLRLGKNMTEAVLPLILEIRKYSIPDNQSRLVYV